MRSISALCGVAVVGGVLALGSPAGHAETAKGSCSGAMNSAKKAKSSYDSYARELRDLTNQGGHPDRSQRDHLDRLRMNSDDASSMANRTCGKPKPAKPRKTMPKSMPKPMPHGKVKAGAGAMSATSGPSDLALTSSAALVAGAAGVWLLRRRDDEELG
ncbi:hypothetical protein [Streptomyces sp. NPDC059649]|uniref:hypothetical protein n=1 Tax=Streptomyces sp. NPDC059649 TaxID=3346895 RepID=UPI0036A73E51